MEAEEKYYKDRSVVEKQIDTIKKQIEMYQKKIEQVLNMTELSEMRKQKQLEVFGNAIRTYKSQLKRLEEQIEFMRPETQEDNEYRMRILNQFGKQVKETVPEDSLLLFHGTNIQATKAIIESGELTSPGERGVHSDVTSEGLIWVTDKDSMHTCIDYAYISPGKAPSMPSGCLFVLVAKDIEEKKHAGKMLMIPSISFRTNPERLQFVLTTPENIEMVKKWMEESGLDSSIVKGFDEFLEIIQKRENAQDSEKESQAPKKSWELTATQKAEIEAKNAEIVANIKAGEGHESTQSQQGKDPIIQE